ncbi:three-finger toxin W-V-like [Anolis carolinensis]|uniref:three-finger toxin W-V-like n=1 Tax=Anolis carolinensis TaxID=28377 RepID=UPI002F2B70D0
MNEVLTIAFFSLIYLHTGGALSCWVCKFVAKDDRCKHPEKLCESRGFDFCYNRLITKGKTIVKVDRGCTSVCRNTKKSQEDFEEIMVCCVKDYCNFHNFWIND